MGMINEVKKGFSILVLNPEEVQERGTYWEDIVRTAAVVSLGLGAVGVAVGAITRRPDLVEEAGKLTTLSLFTAFLPD